MAEDRIIVDVDDTAVDAAIAKLQMYLSQSQQSFGTRNVVQGARVIQRQTEQLQFTLRPVTDQIELLRYRLASLGVSDLPGVNREMRIILGQIPGMREAMRLYFNVKRLGRGIERADLQLTLSLLATAVLLIKWIMDRQRTLERRQREYEGFIRRERGLTHDQYLELMEEWQVEFRRIPG